MKYKCVRFIESFLLLLMAMLFLVPQSATAADAINLHADVSLSLEIKRDGVPVADAFFELYRVADISENFQYTLTKEFEKYPISLDTEDWEQLAVTLDGYVKRDKLTPVDSGKTDQNGVLVFPQKQEKMQQGMYLVVGQKVKQGKYVGTVDPFLISLPARQDDGTIIYEIKAKPKYDWTEEDTKKLTVKRKVLKIWKDNGYEAKRPKKIVIQLLRDNEVYDTVTLSEENNWRYIWEELDGSYDWTVVEKEVEGYKVKVSKQGITYTVTNTYQSDSSSKVPKVPTPSGETRLPQTGQLWWPVPWLSAVGLALVLIGLIRRKGGTNEA